MNRHELSGPPDGPLLTKHEKTPKTLGFSGFQVAAAGLEPANVFTGSEVATEESGHTGGPFGVDPDLLMVVEAWPTLTDDARRMIVNLCSRQ